MPILTIKLEDISGNPNGKAAVVISSVITTKDEADSSIVVGNEVSTSTDENGVATIDLKASPVSILGNNYSINWGDETFYFRMPDMDVELFDILDVTEPGVPSRATIGEDGLDVDDVLLLIDRAGHADTKYVDNKITGNFVTDLTLNNATVTVTKADGSTNNFNLPAAESVDQTFKGYYTFFSRRRGGTERFVVRYNDNTAVGEESTTTWVAEFPLSFHTVTGTDAFSGAVRTGIVGFTATETYYYVALANNTLYRRRKTARGGWTSANQWTSIAVPTTIITTRQNMSLLCSDDQYVYMASWDLSYADNDVRVHRTREDTISWSQIHGIDEIILGQQTRFRFLASDGNNLYLIGGSVNTIPSIQTTPINNNIIQGPDVTGKATVWTTISNSLSTMLSRVGATSSNTTLVGFDAFNDRAYALFKYGTDFLLAVIHKSGGLNFYSPIELDRAVSGDTHKSYFILDKFSGDAAKGLTEAEITSLATSLGLLTSTDATTLINSLGYLEEAQVRNIVDAATTYSSEITNVLLRSDFAATTGLRCSFTNATTLDIAVITNSDSKLIDSLLEDSHVQVGDIIFVLSANAASHPSGTTGEFRLIGSTLQDTTDLTPGSRYRLRFSQARPGV